MLDMVSSDRNLRYLLLCGLLMSSTFFGFSLNKIATKASSSTPGMANKSSSRLISFDVFWLVGPLRAFFKASLPASIRADLLSHAPNNVCAQ
jgi:hypothetical protein